MAGRATAALVVMAALSAPVVMDGVAEVAALAGTAASGACNGRIGGEFDTAGLAWGCSG